MGVEHVTSLNVFNSIVKNASDARLVVVDFTAVWCGPCKAIAPLFDTLERRYVGRARFLKIDVDEAKDIARSCGVSSMPTFHFYRRGQRVAEFSGANPALLTRTIEEHAPTNAEVSFTGSGQRLGASSNSAAAATAVAAPPTTATVAPGSGGVGAAAAGAGAASSMREAAALAASRRFQSTRENPTVAGGSPSNNAGSAASADGAGPSAGAKANDVRLSVDAVMLKQMIDEMGFPAVRAEKALILTGNKSLEAAVDWCFEHADDPDVDEPLSLVTPDGAPKRQLTSEDARKKAEELYTRARAKREAEEKRDAAEREKDRLKSGKEMAVTKDMLESEARKRAVEDRRRQKREEQAQRQRVRDMLEADKERRRQRFNMPGAPPANSSAATDSNPVAGAAAVAAKARTPTASSDKGRILFRLPDGSRLEGDFTAEQTMGDIIAFLGSANPSLASRTLKLSQQYPRKTFSQDDYATPLGALHLLPRGALTVSF